MRGHRHLHRRWRPMLIRRALGDPADREFLQEALNYFLLHYREHKLDSTHAV